MIYKRMYFKLFNGVSDALLALQEQNYGIAKRLLLEAQRATEELYLSCETDGNENILADFTETTSQRGSFREDEQQGI